MKKIADKQDIASVKIVGYSFVMSWDQCIGNTAARAPCPQSRKHSWGVLLYNCTVKHRLRGFSAKSVVFF
ncbi:MAG: hypothetical protein K5766_00100 [Alphaproteobacteria bacterium]|nr:hypothetical protein [Alphaproteobacteria bacterium]